MSLFFTIVLLIWSLMHVHVAWHLSGLHVIRHRWLRIAIRMAAALAWCTLPAMPVAHRLGMPGLADGLSAFWTTWLGMLFLMFSCLLAVDVLTLGGFVFKKWIRNLRFGASLLGILLSSIAALQGLRDPSVVRHEVVLPRLPANLDGTSLLIITDTHLGTQIGEAWFQRLTRQAAALAPDAILIGGDLIDRDASKVFPMIPSLRELRAPLGVWVAEGNHDGYANSKLWEQIVREAGYQPLRNRSVLLKPGLRLAGVDDLGLLGRLNAGNSALKHALSETAPEKEALILLSHTPVLLDEQEAAGVGLSISGHTHGGQIWPFNYVVATRFRFIEGLNTLGRMQVLISRGAGTWGPRMRLWKSGEILLVTLRSPKAEP